MTRKGQIVIPKPWRDAMELSHGRPVDISPQMKAGKIIAVVVKPAPDIMELAGAFKAPKGRNALKAREYMEKHYERR